MATVYFNGGHSTVATVAGPQNAYRDRGGMGAGWRRGGRPGGRGNKTTTPLTAHPPNAAKNAHRRARGHRTAHPSAQALRGTVVALQCINFSLASQGSVFCAPLATARQHRSARLQRFCCASRMGFQQGWPKLECFSSPVSRYVVVLVGWSPVRACMRACVCARACLHALVRMCGD